MATAQAAYRTNQPNGGPAIQNTSTLRAPAVTGVTLDSPFGSNGDFYYTRLSLSL